jgi:hypothetical protein
MAAIARVNLEISVTDDNGAVQDYSLPPIQFAPGSLGPKREVVSFTGSAFTALSPPSGSKLCVIFLPNTATSVTAKGVTGDSGLPVVPASNAPGLPLFIPLGASPQVGLTNAGSTFTAPVLWL